MSLKGERKQAQCALWHYAGGLKRSTTNSMNDINKPKKAGRIGLRKGESGGEEKQKRARRKEEWEHVFTGVLKRACQRYAKSTRKKNS